jgi:hypothetical protein
MGSSDVNAWVALSIRTSPDGKADVKLGPLGGVMQGTGTFDGSNFSAQIPSDGIGSITLKGQQTIETQGKESLTAITGTIDRNPGETGEFTVVEIPEAKKMYDAY